MKKTKEPKVTVKPIVYTREEAETLILNKECDNICEGVFSGDLSYAYDIFYSGFKGYIHFTNKQLEDEIREQMHILVKIKN